MFATSLRPSIFSYEFMLASCGTTLPKRHDSRDPVRPRGIEFVSLSEQVDTSTPTGKMVFTVLGAVAELERSLICERVRAGLRNARAKGKRLGRPPKNLDTEVIAALRRKGLGWRAIAKQLGVGVGTLYRVAPGRSKIREEVFGTR